MTSPKSREELADSYASQFVYNLKITQMLRDAHLAGHASRDHELAAKDAGIAELEAQVARLRDELRDASQAGTPYWKERDLQNALIIENQQLKALLGQAAEALSALDAGLEMEDVPAPPGSVKCILALKALKAAGFGKGSGE